MTGDRAQAYKRVVDALDELAATKLLPGEQERIREAADTLLFADGTEQAVGDALSDVDALVQHLVDCDRWSEERARRLLDDVAACGPLQRVA
jgi:hypothetical protein